LGLKNKTIMSFKEFTVNLTTSSNEIILLERHPKIARIRSAKINCISTTISYNNIQRVYLELGNATGSDEAFAKGIALVDPTRLEYVLPDHRDGKKEINTTRKND
jgi:hypothetical protein